MFLLFFVIPVIKAIGPYDIVLGGKYTDYGTGFYKRGTYYDVKADGVKLPGVGRNAFEWFNFNNDKYVDAYSLNEVWQGNGSYVYSESNMPLRHTDWVSQFDQWQLQAIDFNNDGRLDMKTNCTDKPEEVLVHVRGQWYPTRMPQLSMEEYWGEQEDLVLHTGQGLGSGVSFVGGNGNPGTKTSTLAIDFNSDGYVDFIDVASGLCYQNLGDGRYVLNKVGGQLTFRDFNQDGIVDYVLFDSEDKKTSVFLSQTDGTWKEQVIISNLYSDEEVSCYDFDKDGDVDILITLSQYVKDEQRYTHDNGGSFVLLMENRGDGSFKQHEFIMDGTVYFRQCLDINGDGYYEIVAQKKQDGKENLQTDLVYYTLKGMTVSDTPVLLKSESGMVDYKNLLDYDYLLADLDNSGYIRILYENSADEIPDAKANTRPVSPSKPRFVYDAGKGTIKVEWDAGHDAECTSADLTYALRIGSAEEKGDMLFAHALPDGRRRNLLEGNCGYVRSRTLNVSSWPAGKYYISVQSVDPGCLGSEFSPYAIFEKKEPAVDFILSCDEYFSVGDTCTVILLGNVETSCTYDWDWNGATVLSRSEDGSEYKIIFTQGGEKHIALKATTTSGVYALMEHSLEVNPGNVKNHNFETGASIYDVPVAIDLDEDGKTEVYVNDGINNKFYEGDDNARYSTIKKIWNSNLPSGNKVVADINRDGKVDMVCYGNQQPYSLVNEGNKQMIFTELPVTGYYDGEWRDFNNDGLLEPLYYKNMGDYATFENVRDTYNQHISGSLDKESYVSVLVDYDRDGLVDFIDADYYWEYNISSVTLFRNNGDFTFTPEKLDWIDWQSGGENLLEDLDGDGLWDYIHDNSSMGHGNTWYSDHVRIQWGGGDTLLIPAESGLAFGFIQKIVDVDNNGYLDLIFSTNERKNLVIYFNKNRSYKIGLTDDINVWYTDYMLTDGRTASGITAFSGVSNTKPSAPEQIRASQDEKFVTLEWNHSTDRETPNTLMRYNISIRRKGVTGEGAYLFSPLNSAKNGVHVSSPYPLLPGNKFRIPVQNIPAGEYEVQVQGVDRAMLESDFSETYLLTVTEKSLIEMPTSAGVGREIGVKIIDNSGQTVNFGPGASARKNADGSYTVTWDSEGRKTVKVGALASQDIYVYPLPQGDFSLPEKVLLGAKVNLEGENMNQCSWTYSLNDGQPCPVDKDSDVKIESLDEYHAVVTFGKVGRYKLFHHVADDFNTVTYSSTTEVDGVNPAPVISMIDIEPESGHYRLNWSTDNLPVGSQSINIYKETSRYDKYELLVNLSLTETAYVDFSSMPDHSASRYYITCVLPYGETMASVAHQPIHVMINKGMENTWNLIWTQYEGRDIESYRILGGISADNLRTIAEVSGHQISYSDLNASSDMKYYAVEMIPDSRPMVRKPNEVSTAIITCRSNIVSTENVISTVLAEQITVLSDKEDMIIDGNASETSLQLMACIYPLNVTVQRISWQIVEGNDIATISTSGLLTATGNGIVTVRAYAVDGSEVYGETQVHVTSLTAIEQIKQENNRPELKISFSEGRLSVWGMPTDEKATLYVYNTNGCLITVGKVSDTNATVDCGYIPAGVFLCRVVMDKWTYTMRFFKP